jgi:DegV family protein with EDD domain
LVKEGNLSAKEIVAELNKKKSKIQVLALLDTLQYLRKGGRISSVTAIAGEVFSIKPVITIAGGEVKMAGKAIGSRKGNNLLNQLVEKSGGINFDLPYAVAYSGLSDEFLRKYMRDSASLWQGKTDNVPAYIIGSTIGTHIGPNAIAVSFFAN